MLPAVVSDIELTPALTDRLVEAVAFGMEDLRELLFEAGIQEPAFETLLGNPFFMRRIREARLEWLHPSNASKRSRMKTDVALEESIQPTYCMAIDPNIPPADRVKAVLALRSMSSIQKEQDEMRTQKTIGGGGGTNIYFNLLDTDSGGRTVVAEVGNRGQALEHDAGEAA